MGLAYSVVDECAEGAMQGRGELDRHGRTALEAELEVDRLRCQLAEAVHIVADLRTALDRIRKESGPETWALTPEWPRRRARATRFERATRADIVAPLGVHTPPSLQRPLDLREWISPGMESHGEIQNRDLPTEVSR